MWGKRMSETGFLITSYLLAGMLIAFISTFLAARYGDVLELDEMTRFIIRDQRFMFPLMTLLGVPLLFLFIILWLNSWRRRSKLTIRVRDREFVVWAYRDKQGRLETQTINLDHESFSFLDELEEAEFVEWMELIRLELNRTGRFDREVLLWHLYRM